MLPLEATPATGTAVEDPWVLAQVIYHPCYIGGWSAAEHWGLTEQIFRPTFVVTAANIRARRETMLGSEFHVVRVSPKALAGTTSVWRGKERVPVSDRERTIVDAANHPEWVGGTRQLAGMLAEYKEAAERRPERLAATLADHGRGAAHKRLGYLVEIVWPEATPVRNRAREGRSSGIIKLDPTVRSAGRLNKRWGLWLNVDLATSTRER